MTAKAKRFTRVRPKAYIELEDEDGKITPYTLTGLDGKTGSEWKKYRESKIERDKDGNVKEVDMEFFREKLIQLSITDSEGKSLELGKIASWPESTIEGVYDECQLLNGWIRPPEKEDEAPKGESPETTATGSASLFDSVEQ